MKSNSDSNSGSCGRASVSSKSGADDDDNSIPLTSSLKRDAGKSAFSPYKVCQPLLSRLLIYRPGDQPSTVLTNLQRGNVQTQTQVVAPERSFHQLAAQGELFVRHLDDVNVNEVDENGFTSLLWACSYGQLATVKMLLMRGADPSIPGKNGETALLLASANGHLHIVKELLNFGIDPNQVDEDNNSALMFAAFNNHALCVNELLKAGADVTLQNSNLDTAFSIAVKKSNKQVQLVLEKYMLSLLT